MDTIYIETAVATAPLTARILARFPQARHITIDNYRDVFNASGQNFRRQKQNPALLLACKHGKRLHPTPPGYHIGGRHNYYFSHMLNCIYDCRYCFLQGMYRSANHVVFVNQQDFLDDISAISNTHQEQSYFFSGYDCDSLALDPITGFVDAALAHFEHLPNATLELRTKSTQIRPLLRRAALGNVVVAYSLSPESIAKREEHGAPSLDKRLDALATLQQQGWPIGLRFDPLLACTDFESVYAEFFAKVADRIDMAKVHSVSLGLFRLPVDFHRRLVKLYPCSELLAESFETRDGLVSYPEQTSNAMRNYCLDILRRYIRDDQLFPCS